MHHTHNTAETISNSNHEWSEYSSRSMLFPCENVDSNFSGTSAAVNFWDLVSVQDLFQTYSKGSQERANAFNKIFPTVWHTPISTPKSQITDAQGPRQWGKPPRVGKALWMGSSMPTCTWILLVYPTHCNRCGWCRWERLPFQVIIPSESVWKDGELPFSFLKRCPLLEIDLPSDKHPKSNPTSKIYGTSAFVYG